MSMGTSFEELLRRVRAGDQAAAAELVQSYEPAVRRAVRFRLRGAGLSSALESMDICQSVLASFFVRTAAGQFDIQSSDDLVKLLVGMARNKLVDRTRRARAQRRDNRRVAGAGSMVGELPAAQATPSQQVATRDLLQEVYRRLSPDELELVKLRNEGEDWEAIAVRQGATAEVLRKRFSRALDRVSRELGLEDEHA